MIRIICTHCREPQEIPTTSDKIREWHESNENIQDKLPELTPAQRELLLSGICEDCWDVLMTEENDEDHENDT